jgi:hypothetical protein
LTNIGINNFSELEGLTFNVNIVNTEPITITGFNFQNYSTETKQDTQIEELVKVVDKRGDIEANIYLSQSSTITADTVPPVGRNDRDPLGWGYNNTNPGNSMNLYYFNGADETKTLNQVVGQYTVITNLSTKLNNSLIFGIYTKSNSSFFTTRITHSPAGGVNLTAGGKFLCYWGEVPGDLYPTLPRLNFTDITTTGPAVPTEEILSVSLNTDSGTPAGDILIFIESLGVVFNNSGVNQSRVLNLLSDDTFYTLTSSTTEFTQLINNYLANLTKTNGGLDVYIKNDTPISVSVSNTTPISVSFDSGITVSNISETPLITGFALESAGNLEAIKTNTDKNTYTDDNLNVNIASGSFTFPSGITVLNFPTSINSKTQDGSGANNITSTDLLNDKRGLDTASNLFCYTSSLTRTAIICDDNGRMNVRATNYDYLGNGISSTTTSISGTASNSLDTASSLYVSTET